ncbi:MAG: hypothetical protein WCK88_07055 [bacterium]
MAAGVEWGVSVVSALIVGTTRLKAVAAVVRVFLIFCFSAHAL